MLNVDFHATNGKTLSFVSTHREVTSTDNKLYSYVEVTLDDNVTLYLSPDNATQLAKALLSQVQQIEEKEIQENA